MNGEPHAYLEQLPADQREMLARVNRTGVRKLREYLDGGTAIAFLGAGASAPLYPLWDGLIAELVDAAEDRLDDQAAATCRHLARSNPDGVVEIVRQRLSTAVYREVLRHILRVRRHPETSRTFTKTHELVARCAFARLVTTNYDPGIVDARVAARPGTSVTGFASYTNEDTLDRWISDDVLGDIELPVLFAHGRHDQPDSVVLASTEYRRAYRGKLGRVLGGMVERGHLVWVGFSFSDQRIAAIVREIGDASGSHTDPGQAPRHVAILGWDPTSPTQDPVVTRDLMAIQHGCDVVLYPAPDGNHAALADLLADFTDPQFAAVPDRPPKGHASVLSPPATVQPALGPVTAWVHGGEPIKHFVGRADEIARLDRWASDPEVGLIGVTAWGGAGKTALVTEWLAAHGGARRRAARGIFAWSFYEDNSADRWAEALLEWAGQLAAAVPALRPEAQVRALLSAVPLVVVLDGLEVTQEGPGDSEFGRLLDGLLRDVLVGQCQRPGQSLVVLTSRFPFADLERFSGASARMLEVPPFTAAEGAESLGAAGAGWLGEAEREVLSDEIHGHALAVEALGRVLATRPSDAQLVALRSSVTSAARTDQRVTRVLNFYADRLSETDRLLVAWVSLFQRPVAVDTILALAAAEVANPWTSARVEAAVRGRLGGLLHWHPDGTVSAHPLVRETFRPIVLSADTAARATEVALADVPQGRVGTRAEALRVVEMIELLVEANQWKAADDLYTSRAGEAPRVWRTLPAPRLGLRAASAFVGTPDREAACRAALPTLRFVHYSNAVGLFAMYAGELATATRNLDEVIRASRVAERTADLAIALQTLAECYCVLGQPDRAAAAAREARELATARGDDSMQITSLVQCAAVYDLTGRSAEAERCFVDADRIQRRTSKWHLRGLSGHKWADFLLRTNRHAPGGELTRPMREIARGSGWNYDIARSDRALGLWRLACGDFRGAGRYLDDAVAGFRDGDMVTDMVATLPDLAEQRRQIGSLDEAESICGEAIALAGARDLVPAHARALATRARVRGDRFPAADPAGLERGRDDADATLRLATQWRQLPWQELDAYEAHAYLDQRADVDRGWRARADALRAKLIPPGLDPDPLATVEAEIAAEAKS